MQVIKESLDDLKRLETAIEDATKGELDYSDKLFLLASSAQSKAIAGLALAIKESGGQDTRRLTRDAPATEQPCPACTGKESVKRDGGNVGRCIVCDGTGHV